ncbi:MAG TPA: HAMP domain-containing sensor histidine kinase [Ilumatobacteraceae bacterium]|nr:HAMP domain-containing sensor histidine kinase [Ilumatobacteraceae bacterium]
MTTEPGSRRPWRPGIRARVVIGYVALLAAALTIAAVVTRQVLLARLDRDIDRALTQEVEELRLLAAGTDPATGEPFGDDVEAIFDTFLSRSVPADDEAFYTLIDGEPFLRSFDAPAELFDDPAVVERWAGTTAPRRDDVDSSIGAVRSLAVPLGAGGDTLGTFVVVYFPASERASISQILRVLSVAGGIVLVASGALAWSLAGRVLRPVRDLTETARDISETDLSARIPVEGHDELAELGTTFNAMLDRLQRGFDGQRQFLDDVAHELRTPITIVQGHLDLLGDDADDRAETIAIITDELDRMNRYVNDLLLLAQSERGDFLHLEPIDLTDFAASTLRTVSAMADREWGLEVGLDDPVTIAADSRRLSQAVLNLVANAVEHTTTGDRIHLGVGVEGEHATRSARLWVEDSGSGIDPDVAESLFRRSERGATSRASRPEGMGIGLSIVDAVAAAHGGRTDVANVDGGGTRFTLVLPAPNGMTTEHEESHMRASRP